MSSAPLFDDYGINVFDPNDRLGRKSEYITLLQEKALLRYLPRGEGKLAVDLGCGYGRLTPVLERIGWVPVGVDPSEELIRYAKSHSQGAEYLVGALPALPIGEESIGLVLLQNVLRPLKLMNLMSVVKGIGRYVEPGGYIAVVENMRVRHEKYVTEDFISETMQDEGFELAQRVPIRAARWWMIYAIRYGLVAQRFFPGIAEWELRRMSRRKTTPRCQYYNVLFIYRKSGRLDESRAA